MTLGLDNETAEVKQRISLGSVAFGRLRLIFDNKMNNNIDSKIDPCVLVQGLIKSL